MKYILTPKVVKLKEVIDSGFTLSAGQFKRLITPNINIKTVRQLLDRNLQRKDLGSEVGYINIAKKSPQVGLN